MDLQFIDIKGAVLGPRQFLATESPFKMMKNAFYLTLKTPLVLALNFCSEFLIVQANGLTRKLR